ncbi:hypothetical protein D915_000493 [Fasciola hepatica]|uniref:Uncharacterized protein n=1 Tax=Fasciola hepatica TaxID=6192 RepID=A0A4E0RY75_FASHE|nr:hypothetical protein D915_000493 [Fasciola hepatica]
MEARMLDLKNGVEKRRAGVKCALPYLKGATLLLQLEVFLPRTKLAYTSMILSIESGRKERNKITLKSLCVTLYIRSY